MGLVQRPINPKVKDVAIGPGSPKDLVKINENVKSRKESNGLRKWAEDAQGIKWAGKAQDVIWTNPAGILGSVN